MFGASLVRLALIAALPATMASAQPRTLVPSQSLSSELKPGDRHDYQLEVKARQAFEVHVDQGGIDLVVSVASPTGELLVEADRASEAEGTKGTEKASVQALAAGLYRISIVPFVRDDAKPATYTITVAGMRDLTPAEADNAQSERDILTLEQRWGAAVGAGDLATLTSILRNDAVKLGTIPAAAQTRAEIVAGWERLRKMRAEHGFTETHTFKDMMVRVAGDTAMSSARYLITRSYARGGEPSKVTGQFVHVWARKNGSWNIVGDYAFPFGRLPRTKVETVSVAASLLSGYAGTYQLANPALTFTVALENGGLVGHWTGPRGPSSKMPLKAVSDVTFIGPDELEFTFVRGADGPVRELLIIGDGPADRGVKEEPVAARER